METLFSDIRYALRTIRRSPGVIVVAVISLGLGIGANATLFSAVDVFLFRPLPYDDADRLTHVYSTVPARGWDHNSVSIPDFLDLREQSQTMDIATSYGRDFNLSGGDLPERMTGERVSWNYFRVLRITPILGRWFLPEEERMGAHHVAIISNGLWQRRYGSDPAVIGTTVELDGESYSIVGVLPPRIRVYERRTPRCPRSRTVWHGSSLRPTAAGVQALAICTGAFSPKSSAWVVPLAWWPLRSCCSLPAPTLRT